MQKEVYEFISRKNNDPIVERRTCAVSGKEFAIFQSDKEFYDKISPTFNGQKYQIPFPTLCPEERSRRRMAWRNDNNFYRGKCDLSGNSIISLYHPGITCRYSEKPYTVYKQQVWRSDQRDPMDYGRDYDFSRPFFEQFDDLLHDVPQIAIMNDDGLGTSENCAYCQDFSFGKNCYMVTGTWKAENSLYCDCCLQVKNLVDCTMVNNNSEDVYRGNYCTNIQYCYYIQASTDCHHCSYSYDIHGCSYCFGCVSLYNKQYCIFNRSYSREEYFEKITSLQTKSHKQLRDEFIDFKNTLPHVSAIVKNSKNCIGHHIFNSENVVCGFDVVDVQNAKYCTRLNSNAKDCYDIYQSGSPVLTYEGLTPDKAYHCAFVNWCWEGCQYLYYCDNCHGCSHCFGCSGLRHQSYCIFNKQYHKEEYDQLVVKIIKHMQENGEWGEYFPVRYSPFGYNETVAQEYFPLTREEALKKGYSRYDVVDYTDTTSYNHIVDYRNGDAIDVTDTEKILSSAFICAISGKPFRVTKQELQFYHQHNIPLPQQHPTIRRDERRKQRPDRELYLRKSDKSGKKMISVYPNNVSFPVYNHEEYDQEVYS